MQRLRKFWQDMGVRTGLPSHRLTEYILIGAYSLVAILSLIIGITAKRGTLFGHAVEATNYGAKPEWKSILKQLAMASADFSVGLSLLIIAVLIVYWSRRGKRAQPQEITLHSGPPFLL